MTSLDLSLYAIFDPDVTPGIDMAHALRAAAAGGVSLLQLRCKSMSTNAFLRLAVSAKAALAGTGVALIINDRVDIAMACEADGVHVGQDDLPADAARRILGANAIIGLTVRSEAEAYAAPLDVIDYVGLGGVFATASKVNDTAPLGLDGFRRLADMLRSRRPDLPICAIAGITVDNCGSVIAAGADGIAVISAIFADGEPAMAAARLFTEITKARANRR